MTKDTGNDRKSQADIPAIITDSAELARREAENGLLQFDAVIGLIEQHTTDKRPFKLRASLILTLNREALRGIHSYAGNYRPADVEIQGSKHQPPSAHLVPELLEELCDYVNNNWESASALHLAAYVMWRLNWIHPFADGNGRTSRAVSYLVLCIKLGQRLSGIRTIPDLIAENKHPYYDALEAADAAWSEHQQVNLTSLETLLQHLLAAQLLSIIEKAQGKLPT